MQPGARTAGAAVALGGLGLLLLLLLSGWGMPDRVTSWGSILPAAPAWERVAELPATAPALPPPLPPGAPECRRWAAVERLPGGCIGVLEGSKFACCGGPNYACSACSQDTIAALRCTAPRHLLLRPATRCGLPPPLPAVPPRRPAAGCGLPFDAVWNGSWEAPTVAEAAAPALPAALFRLAQPAGGSGGDDGKTGSSSSSSSSSSNISSSKDTGSSNSSDESSAASSSGIGEAAPACAPPTELLALGGAEAASRCLWGAGFDRVLIAGDSGVRHLFVRLVSLLRQQEVSIDGGGMQHAHYSLRAWEDPAPPTPPGSGDSSNSSDSGDSQLGGPYWATDSLWFSGSANYRPGSWDERTMEAGMQRLLRLSREASAPAAGGIPSAGLGSSGGRALSRSLIVDFLIGATELWQLRHVRRYAEAALGGGGDGRRTLLLVGLCYWEQRPKHSEAWLAFVDEMRQAVGQVVLLTCPTDRLTSPEHAALHKAAAARNEELRSLVAEGRGGRARSASGGAGGGVEEEAPPPLMLLDMDALSRQLPKEWEISQVDFHHACHLASASANQRGALTWAGGDGAPLPRYPLMRHDHLRAPPGGRCSDPVNYAAWQLLFTMLRAS